MRRHAIQAKEAALARHVASVGHEVAPGYRACEVGTIPLDWLTASCEELTDSAAPICYGLVQVGKHVDNGIPIIAIKSIEAIGNSGHHRADKAIERRYGRSRVTAGDVLLSIKGTIGRVGVVPKGFEGNISRELARLRPRTGLLPEYLAYQLESSATQARIAQAVVGTTRLEFSIATLRHLSLPIPPTPAEQRAIAEALSDVDELLGALDELIAKKRAIKRAAMQQLLTGKTRLPGLSGEWETKPLDDLAAVSKGEQLRVTDAEAADGYPHLNGGISPSGFAKTFNKPANTIAVSEGGNSCGYVQFIKQAFWCGGHCYSVLPRDIDKAFLFHALKQLQPMIMRLRVGSGLPNVQQPALKSLLVSYPRTSEEQITIANVLSDMDAEIAGLEGRRDKTQAIKQGMMQQLLTGRIRLVKPEEAAC